MAVTAFNTNHALTVKVWAKRLFVEALKQTKFSRFLGNSASSLIQRRTELAKGPGDRITIGLRMQLSGPGTLGDGTLEGTEEALTLFSDNLFIDQLRHAVRTGGKMSQQRVAFDIREESMEGLRDWWADRMDLAFFNQIGGATVTQVAPNMTYTGTSNAVTTTDTRYSGNQATIAPVSSTTLLLGGTLGQASTTNLEVSLSNTVVYNLNLQDIDRCVARAKTNSPAIRPIKVGGEDKFVMFIHPFQTYTLRKSAGTAGQWADIQKAAMQGGQVSNNPIYTGSIGEFNGVILHEDARVAITQGVPNDASAITNFYRGTFCGAQAAGFAVGQGGGDGMMDWVEELFDYGNQIGVEAGMIWGLKKMVFNSNDFSTIVVTTSAPKP